MMRRIGSLAVAILLLGVLIPAPASAHTRSWIGTDLNIIYRYRTRGGTGFAVAGYLEVLNKKASARSIVCTLEAVHKERLRAEDVASGETEDLGFFMSTWRSGQNPKILHCHGDSSNELIGANRRL